MARSDIMQLYEKLLSTQFNFVPRGEQELQTVYQLVRYRYPLLCDDTFLCRENCSNGNNSPEWQHAVRRVLGELKRKHSTEVTPGSRRGYWTFRGVQLAPIAIAIDFEEPQTPKVAITTYRAIRDTTLTRKIKVLHRNACQICGEIIPLPHGQTYSEAHHVKPLGEPHNGPDIAGNILILCPNHHAMCDYGSIRLDINSIRKHPDHVIGEEFIEYHNTQIADVLPTLMNEQS